MKTIVFVVLFSISISSCIASIGSLTPTYNQNAPYLSNGIWDEPVRPAMFNKKEKSEEIQKQADFDYCKKLDLKPCTIY